ncbi:MAG: redoxin domain-containing protein [Nitrospiria bacterium]
MNRLSKNATLLTLSFLFVVGMVFPDMASGKRAALGRSITPFVAKTLKGKTISINQLKGRVVLIDFWATWCDPCREELPELNALYQELQSQGVEILGISVDRKRENVDEFISKHSIRFPIIHDQNKAISDDLRPRAMPTAFILDQGGVVRHVHLGYKKSYLQLYRDEIKALLQKGTKE